MKEYQKQYRKVRLMNKRKMKEYQKEYKKR